MGYITRPIASDKKSAHKQVSLSGLSNFLELEGSTDSVIDSKIEIKIEVNQTNFDRPPVGSEDAHLIPQTKIVISEKSAENQKHTFQGTYDFRRISDTTFLLVPDDTATTAENLRACLLRNTFFRSRFHITIPLVTHNGMPVNGDTIVIQSLGTGKLYEFEVESHDNTFITLDGDPGSSGNSDLVDRGMGNVNIEAEVYTDTDIFLGEDDTPSSQKSLGRHIATMSKAYFGHSTWFDVNAFMNANKTYSDDFLRQADHKDDVWTDAGTINDIRLVMKKNDGSSRETFYYSNVMYAVTGYARTLQKVDLDGEYVFEYAPKSDKFIRPLTTQPLLPHVRGQVQYFNFLFKDPTHKLPQHTDDYRLGIRYDLYTQSGKFIKRIVPEKMFMPKGKCYMVNNILLNIDEVVQECEAATDAKVGIVKAALCCNNRQVSHPLQFRIMPECLYKVCNFAFLNSLGGWSSFNFGGEKSVEAKATANTLYTTQTPDYTISSRIESVFEKEIKESYSVKTLPVSAEVAEWLREIGASVAVYELDTNRYVVVDDFNIKYDTAARLFVFEMKYHYSDTYNAVVK